MEFNETHQNDAGEVTFISQNKNQQLERRAERNYCGWFKVFYNAGHRHTLSLSTQSRIFARALAWKWRRTGGKATQWEVENRRRISEAKAVLPHKLLYHVQLPSGIWSHAREWSSLYSGLMVLPAAVYQSVCVCVCVLVDFEFCLFLFACVHLYHTDIHQWTQCVFSVDARSFALSSGDFSEGSEATLYC